MPEKSSLAHWAQAWNKHLVRFLSRRGASREEAEDFAQEAYLRLLRMDDLDLVQSPQAYLFQIAKNLLTEWRMRAAQSRVHSADMLDVLEADEDLQVELEQRQEQRFVHAAIDDLHPVTRQVLLLHVQQDLTYDEIAQQLGLTRRMVKRHMLSAYAALRQRLKGLRPDAATRDNSP